MDQFTQTDPCLGEGIDTARETQEQEEVLRNYRRALELLGREYKGAMHAMKASHTANTGKRLQDEISQLNAKAAVLEKENLRLNGENVQMRGKLASLALRMKEYSICADKETQENIVTRGCDNARNGRRR